MMPPPRLDHLEALLDDTGIAQHATYDVVARKHGYCLDDNARALILAVGLEAEWPGLPVVSRLRARVAAFVQHAWDQDRGVFRNFMSFDRQWLEAVGSDDSHGRTVGALGLVARDGASVDTRAWARWLLELAAPRLRKLTSPRALAAGLLGLATAGGDDALSHCWAPLCAHLANRLCDHLRDASRSDWVWFETSLSYDNSRIPQALLKAGAVFGREEWHRAGLETLEWLCAVQTSERGQFRPIGSDGFYARGGVRALFDQQPLEAAATVAACLEAWRLTAQSRWLDRAQQAHSWFLGANDLDRSLIVPDTGGCRDGLHRDRLNANQGAESTLAWLQADLDLRCVTRARVRPEEILSGYMLDPTGIPRIITRIVPAA